MEPEFLTEIEAKTALETPQILLQWAFDTSLETPLGGVEWPWSSLSIRRSSDRYPESVSEGDAVHSESWSTNPSTSVADISLEPLKSYYYSLFLQYTDHASSPVEVDDDISRLGSVFSGVLREEPDPIVAVSDAVTYSTDVVTSATGEFLNNDVEAGFILRVVGGPDDGYYRIESVDSNSQLTLETALTSSASGVQIEIYSDHHLFWVVGVDYRRKPSIWRYDEEDETVDIKIDLSAILNHEEFPVALGLSEDISGTKYIAFATARRWVRLPRAVTSPTTDDIVNEITFDGVLPGGFTVAGSHFDPGSDTLSILDSSNYAIHLVTESTGVYSASRDLSGLEEVAEDTLRGLSYDGTYYHVGNRNYAMRILATIPTPDQDDIDRITYFKDLLIADLDWFLDPLASQEYVVTVNDVTDRLRTYEVEVGRGGLWQQPYVADVNTIGLYHLDGDATDASAKSNDGTLVGMTSEAGRFSTGYEADSITDHVSIINIAGDWDGDEGSVSVWVKATTPSDLVSGNHRIFVVEVDANNSLKIEITGGTLLFERVAGGTTTAVSLTHPSPDTKWHNYECTWSTTADEFKAYLDGSQQGTTQNGLGAWAGAPVTATIGDSGNSLLGVYDECRVSDVARTVYSPDVKWTSANRMHAHSGRSYTQNYEKGDPLGFFYRDHIYTQKFMGGDYLIRNDYERERLHPPNKLLSSGEVIFRGPDPLPVLGDLGRLSRMIGLFLDRIADDRHLLLQMWDILNSDVDFYPVVADYLGILGLDTENWNVDMQRRYLRIKKLIDRRGGTEKSYRILAKLLGYYVTLHTLQARRRWDSVYYNANFDSNIQAIPLDTMGSMDTGDESFPLALLRFVFYKLSTKSSTGQTSAPGTRLLTDANANFKDTTEVGSLIVIAQGQGDAGDPDDWSLAEYKIEQVLSDTVVKLDRDWQQGNDTDVTYYNYWEIPETDPDTEYLLTRFLDIAPDSMRVERWDETF